jgi:drug/metabolite transporter (DMT)-like permease
MTSLLLGFTAAVAGSALYNAGIALQAIEARTVGSQHALRLSLFRQLIARGRWLLGTAMGLLGWPFQALALLLAPLSVVQPALATGLFVLVIAGRRLLGETVGRRELAGMGAIAIGMVGVVWAAPDRSDQQASSLTIAITLAALGAVSLVPYVLRAARSRHSAGYVAALSAGVAFSATAITTKLFTDAAHARTWLWLLAWLALTGGAAAIAVLSEMTALQTKPVTRVAPAILAIETIVPVLLAPILVHEHWGSTPLGGAALLASLAALVAGVVLLTSSDVVAGVLGAEARSGDERRSPSRARGAERAEGLPAAAERQAPG